MAGYIILTPIKNEIKFLPQVIQSILAQNEKPALWVIIDGGSTDGSVDLITSYTKTIPHTVLVCQHKAGQTPHESVSIAVNEAYKTAKACCNVLKIDYDYIWTIDGDQTLEPSVCGGIFAKCKEDPNIGAASGMIWNPDGTEDTYPEGELPNKRVYSKKAIDDIGGFPVTKYSYDSVILAKLRMKGYKIVAFPEFKITNLRSDSGIERDSWKSHVVFGRARWYLGYSFPLLVAGCGYLTLKKQPVKAVGIFYGYLSSWFNGDEQIKDESIRNHFGKDRLKEIFGGGKHE